MVTTSLLEDITQKAAALPVELQREALNFIEFLSLKLRNGNTAQPINEMVAESATPPARRSLQGALAHLNIRVTAADIAAARREMWSGYMREEAE